MSPLHSLSFGDFIFWGFCGYFGLIAISAALWVLICAADSLTALYSRHKHKRQP